MQLTATKTLLPGMILAEPVKTNRGQTIMNKGVLLTDSLIARISFYGIESVCVAPQESIPEPMELETEAKNAPVKMVYSERIKSSADFKMFQDESFDIHLKLKKCFLKILNSESGELIPEVLAMTMHLLQKPLNTIELFDMLHNMRTEDDAIYVHSVSVAFIAGAFGKWLEFSQSDIELLVLCGLMHDIGKMKIPSKILYKPGPLDETEYAIVKRHPRLGYEALKRIPKLDFHVVDCALMHHERCDGSGYPLNAAAKEINNFAKIIAIADVYDAMTAARSYRSPLCPFQVISAFEHEGLKKYDPHFILTFLEHIAYTYQNNRILLSDGREANIIMLNSRDLSRPIIEVDDGSYINLATSKDLHIASLI